MSRQPIEDSVEQPIGTTTRVPPENLAEDSVERPISPHTRVPDEKYQ